MSKVRSWVTSRFLVYAAGNFINATGNSMYDIAIPLLVYHLTYSSLAMTTTVAIEMCSMFFQPFIGTLVDRTSPRRLFIVAMLYQATLAGLIPLFYHLHVLTIGIIYGVTFFLGFGRNALLSIQTVVIPMMFGDVKDRASVTLTASYTITTVVGPLLGGLLLAASGYQILLWVNCLSFVALVLLLPWTRLPARSPLLYTPSASKRSRWVQTRAGFTELTRHPFTKMLFTTMIALSMVNAAILPLATFLLKHAFHLGNALVSWVFIAQGLGSFIGTQLPRRYKRLSTRHFLLYMALLNGIGLGCMLLPAWQGVPAGLLLGAIGYLGTAVMRNLLLQNHVPGDLLGRASTAFRTATGTAAIVSPLVMGAIATTAEYLGNSMALDDIRISGDTAFEFPTWDAQFTNLNRNQSVSSDAGMRHVSGESKTWTHSANTSLSRASATVVQHPFASDISDR